MNHAGPSLPANIRTLAEGLAVAAEAVAQDPGATKSVRRMAGALADEAREAGLEELMGRAQALLDADPEELAEIVREVSAYIDTLDPSASGAVRHLLVVDDDATSVVMMQGALGAANREVHTARTVSEAREVMGGTAVELVVLDLNLPDGDGRDFLMELRRTPETETLPVVVLSGEKGELAAAECYALGADSFVAKPPDLNALRSAVARHLAEDEAEGEDEPTPPARPREGPPRVLVVEDDDIAATLVEHRLSKAGLVVVRFDDGGEGFRAATTSEFDLILLDVKLPGMDGFDFLRQLRSQEGDRRVPVIILSGLDDEDAVVRGLNLGADDYMPKPFSPPELMARVRRLLDI